MTDNATRIAGGLLLLLGLWVAVYWTWPTEPRITLDGARITTPTPVPPITRPDGTIVAPITPISQDGLPTTKPEPETTTAAGPNSGVNSGQGSTTDTGARVVPPQFTTHTVADGETFAKISRKYFGTDIHANAIARANPFIDPTRLRAGRVIRVPKDPGNIQGKVEDAPRSPKPSGAGSSEYVVQAGDSLSKIAKQVYNDERLANKIYEANRDRMAGPDKLKLGQKLRIPPKND